MIIKIDKLSHDFRGIAKINDKVTFVSNTLPGEVVDIRITQDKKNINTGEVVSYIEKSKYRITSKCGYCNLCGGCDIGYIDYKKSLEYKCDVAKDIMRKYANIVIKPNIIYDGNIFGYRNKITMRVLDGSLALIKEGTREFVNISSCMLVNDRINDVIDILNGLDISCVNEVVIRGNEEIMVIIDGDIDSNVLVDSLKELASSIVLNGNVIYGKEYIMINVNNIKYAIYPNSFFQVNTNMIGKLYNKVLEYAGIGNRLLDLYCGAGTIGIYLSDNFRYVNGIEVNKDAIDGANLNKKINNVSNISFECKRVSDIDKISADVVVVDPPRAGLDKITIGKLIDSDVKKIVYVSCNPITLARDIKLLGDKYDFVDMTLFDMFPNTKHVECCVLLYRKNKSKGEFKL